MRPLLLGILGGLAALVLAGAVAGAARWRYQAAAPDRDRAALVADLDEYDAWYRENTYRRNLGDAYYLPYRDSFIEQHPRLKQYILWYPGEVRRRYGGGIAYEVAVRALAPSFLKEPSMLDAYFAH